MPAHPLSKYARVVQQKYELSYSTALAAVVKLQDTPEFKAAVAALLEKNPDIRRHDAFYQAAEPILGKMFPPRA